MIRKVHYYVKAAKDAIEALLCFSMRLMQSTPRRRLRRRKRAAPSNENASAIGLRIPIGASCSLLLFIRHDGRTRALAITHGHMGTILPCWRPSDMLHFLRDAYF